MGLFGDWANTACGVRMAVCRSTTHRCNFRCNLWNQFSVPIPLFGQEAVQPSLALWLCKSLMDI